MLNRAYSARSVITSRPQAFIKDTDSFPLRANEEHHRQRTLRNKEESSSTPVSFRFPSTLTLTWRGAQPRVLRAARPIVSASGSPTTRRPSPESHSTSCFRFLFPFLPRKPRCLSSQLNSPIDHEFVTAVGLIAPQPQPNTCHNVAPRHCYLRSLRDLALRVITQIALPPIPTQISQAVRGQPTKHGSVASHYGLWLLS